jgi:glycosyltransferase involved in cell wall biosynthesis
MEIPKVLITGQSFDRRSGGGITLSNLFADWDKEKIAVACTPHLIRNPDSQICDNYYQLGEKEHKWIFPFKYLQKKFPSGKIKFDHNQSEKEVSNTDSSSKSDIRSSIVDKVFLPFLKYTGLIHALTKIYLSEDFREWLKDFQPDIIYAQGQDRQRILFALLLENYLKKPLIFHMMDDWPLTISDKGPFKKFWHNKIDGELKRLFNKSSLLMCISDEMGKAYKIRYNKEFKTFHNPIDIQFWKSHQKSNYELNEPPVILYAGKISLGVESSLELIAKAIEKVNRNLNINLRFVLQTKEIPLWTKDYSFVDHRRFVDYNDLPKVFSSADFLVLPYDFSDRSISYVKYSMPTKAPEYMISGTPILIFASEVTAIIKYAKQSDWAYFITENSSDAFARALESLLLHKNLRQKIADNAKKIAENNHSSLVVRNNFKKAISSLISC